MQQKKTLGIFGLGNFGLLLAKILEPYFELKVSSYSNKSKLAKKYNFEYEDLEKVLKCNFFIPAIPVQNLKEFILKNKSKIPTSTTIIDVASVKSFPQKIYQKDLPNHHVILTHPLFGPNSYKENRSKTDDLKMVFCQYEKEEKFKESLEKSQNLGFLKKEELKKNKRDEKEVYFRNICEKKLNLRIFEYTTKKHDQEMAHIQGLTFYLGKIFEKMNIPDSPLNTPTYDHLLKIKQIVSSDSPELFKTIQEFNPETKKIIQEFKKTLNIALK